MVTYFNLGFNYGEFAAIKRQGGMNSYKSSVKEWVETTNGIGLNRLNQVAIRQGGRRGQMGRRRHRGRKRVKQMGMGQAGLGRRESDMGRLRLLRPISPARLRAPSLRQQEGA